MSPHKVVTVRFTETFLCHSEGVLSEDDLRLIAVTLADEPYCGSPSKDIEHLHCLPWSQSEEEDRWNIWYLAYPGLPHIEVVALTDLNARTTDSVSTLQACWKVIRIGMLIRALYKVYKVVRDHIDDFPDLPNFGA
jgi:hypothetical protein